LYICTAGNAGMGTGGMGDVLAGMIASLKAQFKQKIHLHEIVTLHALAGDELAKNGERGLQAQDMKHAIYQVVNR
ncbi:bifunctional ADP-dependent NAD(P)H-hydrate dehydratase/NAD(P)H-hydrate epimerase, partial [Klebsiella pneumoniae]|nr:bifunctional ADP-dependent NAD(P)H-hydrate dehydratase/NAD(P)H-hydrate epimerase [Klebsiella pneumoniae]